MPSNGTRLIKRDPLKSQLHILINFQFDEIMTYDVAVNFDPGTSRDQMQKILADEGASVFIEDPANLIAIKKGYTGFVTYPVSAIDLASIKVAE